MVPHPPNAVWAWFWKYVQQLVVLFAQPGGGIFQHVMLFTSFGVGGSTMCCSVHHDVVVIHTMSCYVQHLVVVSSHM